jgi:hypothetical protein
VVVYLDRAYGRRWSNLVRYAELTWPALFAVGLAVLAAVVGNEPDRVSWAAGAGSFAVIAAVAWVGVVRRWRWWVRWGLYLLCTLALFGLGLVWAILNYAG